MTNKRAGLGQIFPQVYCHSDPAVAAEESRVISASMAAKNKSEMFRFAQHDSVV
jgi:hypothetical protein